MVDSGKCNDPGCQPSCELMTDASNEGWGLCADQKSPHTAKLRLREHPEARSEDPCS